jgi:thymidylate kinase
MDISFHETLRAGFLARAKAEPERIRIIDASGMQETVHRAIIDALTQAFSFPLKPVM